MPTYEYQCESCSHRFEQFQAMTAEPLKTCPVCQKAVRRLIGRGAGIIFKGSGFYQTDYRSSAYRKQAEAEKKESKPEKKESKPEKKSDSAARDASSSEKSPPSSPHPKPEKEK